MNDRFKFRVYNKRLQKMYDVRSMSEYQGSIVRIEVDDYNENNEYKLLIFDDYCKIIEDCILIQCIGLKDRNGVLIYEGDIVKDTGYELDTIYKVGFKKGAFFLENDDVIAYFHELRKCFSESRLEIIGNIYTTPELLEGKE